VPLVVKVFLVLRPAPELPPQEKVFHAGFFEGAGKLLPVVLRHVLGIGMRARIHQHLDGVSGQELKELFQGVVGMTDGKQGGTHVPIHGSHVHRAGAAREESTDRLSFF
jgi:hypothetical protein